MINRGERIDIHRLVIPEVRKTSADFSFDPADMLTKEHWDFLEKNAKQLATFNQYENANILSFLKTLSPQHFSGWNIPIPDISFFNSTESLRPDLELNKATEYRICYPSMRDKIMPHATIENTSAFLDGRWVLESNIVDLLGLGREGLKKLRLSPQIAINLIDRAKEGQKVDEGSEFVHHLSKVKILFPTELKKNTISKRDWFILRSWFNKELVELMIGSTTSLRDVDKRWLLQSKLRFFLEIKTLAAKDIKFTEEGFELVMEKDDLSANVEIPLPQTRRF